MRLKFIYQKAQVLTEWARSEQEIRDILAQIATSDLIDDALADKHYPFIYLIDQDRLYVGEEGEYHGGFARHVSDELLKIYQGGAVYDLKLKKTVVYRKLIGRIGMGLTAVNFSYDLDPPEPDFEKMNLIAMYVKDDSTPKDAQQCVKRVMEFGTRLGISPNNTYVSYAHEAMPVREFLGGGGKQEMSDEDRRLGELQVMLHLGADKNGKRLTPEERRWIEKELGIKREKIIKNPWQQEAENIGMVQPGQKWWAPTSESIE